jgi:hypothetical protein
MYWSHVSGIAADGFLLAPRASKAIESYKGESRESQSSREIPNESPQKAESPYRFPDDSNAGGHEIIYPSSRTSSWGTPEGGRMDDVLKDTRLREAPLGRSLQRICVRSCIALGEMVMLGIMISSRLGLSTSRASD